LEVHGDGCPGIQKSGSHVAGLEQSQSELCYSVGLRDVKGKAVQGKGWSVWKSWLDS